MRLNGSTPDTANSNVQGASFVCYFGKRAAYSAFHGVFLCHIQVKESHALMTIDIFEFVCNQVAIKKDKFCCCGRFVIFFGTLLCNS